MMETEPLDAEYVTRQLKDWEDHAADWRDDARKAYALVAGQQWDDADKTAMAEAGRPVVSLNLITAFIRGICGLEVGNRQEVRYLPRELGDVKPNEALNAAAQWARDQCAAADEESEAFRDMVICGLGAIETRIDYAEDPKGKILVERLDPLQVAWDISAKKRGLSDARWIATWKRLPLSEINRLWPQAELIGADEGDGSDEYDAQGEPHDREAARYYRGGTGGKDPSKGIKVTQYQYYEDVQFVRIVGPTGQSMDVPADKWAAIKDKAQASGVQAQLVRKRVYKQAFIAKGQVLEDGPLPVDRFTLTLLTGFRDRNSGHWYGFVRDLAEPQRYVNKMYSLGLDILASQAKGGLLAEKSAFENPRQAEDDWANPRRIIWMREGGTSKVVPREAGTLPAALQQIFEQTIDLFPRISGVSVEFLGTTDRAQAGVLEHLRKQSTITTLAELFSALSLYRKQQGRVLAEFIVKFLADGRLIRIVGQAGEQYVPLLLQPGALEFDVVVDEAPQSADVKMRTFAVLESMLPLALQGGIPIPPSVVDYMPIPEALASEWKKQLAEPRVPPEVQMQIQEGMAVIQKQQQEIQRLKSDQQLKLQELQAEHAAKMAELQQRKTTSEAEIALKREVASVDAQIEAEKAAAQIILQREKALADWQLKAAEVRAANLDPDVITGNIDELKGTAAKLREEIEQMRNLANSGLQTLAGQLQVAMQPKRTRRNVKVARDKGGRIISALIEEDAD